MMLGKSLIHNWITSIQHGADSNCSHCSVCKDFQAVKGVVTWEVTFVMTDSDSDSTINPCKPNRLLGRCEVRMEFSERNRMWSGKQ